MKLKKLTVFFQLLLFALVTHLTTSAPSKTIDKEMKKSFQIYEDKADILNSNLLTPITNTKVSVSIYIKKDEKSDLTADATANFIATFLETHWNNLGLQAFAKARITLAPRATSACFGSAWDEHNMRFINIILTKTCLTPKKIESSNAIRGGQPSPDEGGVITVGMILYDKFLKMEKRQENIKVNEFQVPINYLWAGSILHEVGHCVQQTLNPAAYKLCRKDVRTWVNPNQALDNALGNSLLSVFTKGLSSYASFKPALMDVYPEAFAMIAMNISVHTRITDFFYLLGQNNVVPQAIYPNAIKIPDLLTDQIADAAYNNFSGVITNQVQNISQDLAQADARKKRVKNRKKARL